MYFEFLTLKGVDKSKSRTENFAGLPILPLMRSERKESRTTITVCKCLQSLKHSNPVLYLSSETRVCNKHI